jgi:hypothetical protein
MENLIFFAKKNTLQDLRNMSVEPAASSEWNTFPCTARHFIHICFTQSPGVANEIRIEKQTKLRNLTQRREKKMT